MINNGAAAVAVAVVAVAAFQEALLESWKYVFSFL